MPDSQPYTPIVCGPYIGSTKGNVSLASVAQNIFIEIRLPDIFNLDIF